MVPGGLLDSSRCEVGAEGAAMMVSGWEEKWTRLGAAAAAGGCDAGAAVSGGRPRHGGMAAMASGGRIAAFRRWTETWSCLSPSWMQKAWAALETTL